MSFAYLRFYTGDYLRDTRHLSPLKHGVYLLLLMHCWDTQGPAPLDEQELSGIANCRSTDEIDALRYVIERFFVRMEDGHYNERMEKEIEKSREISHERSDAGRRGANARMREFRYKQASAKQVPSKCLASDTSLSTSTNININTTTQPGFGSASEVDSSSKVENYFVGITPDLIPPEPEKKAQTPTAAARRVLEQLNRNAGRRYEPVPANMNPILARLREGYTEQELRAITAVKARQWRADDKMNAYLRPKTLFNATNAAQYRAELPASKMTHEEK